MPLIRALAERIIGVLYLLLLSPTSAPPTIEVAAWEPIPEELARIEHADPGANVAKAIREGDLRFLGVAGFVLETPGVPNTFLEAVLVRVCKIRVIEGTTDAGQIPDLQQAAKRYAREYNRLLMDHVKRQRLLRIFWGARRRRS